MTNAACLIAQLQRARGLARAAGSAILCSLETGDNSRWHRVDSGKIRLRHAANALDPRIAATDSGYGNETRPGLDIAAGEAVQQVVPAYHWQEARPGSRADDLASEPCGASPGVTFAGFTLAALDRESGRSQGTARQ